MGRGQQKGTKGVSIQGSRVLPRGEGTKQRGACRALCPGVELASALFSLCGEPTCLLLAYLGKEQGAQVVWGEAASFSQVRWLEKGMSAEEDSQGPQPELELSVTGQPQRTIPTAASSLCSGGTCLASTRSPR